MAGQKILCGFFLVGILLTFSSAKKPSIAIAYQPEDLRAIVIDVIRSELAALNSSTSSSPNDLALKLQEFKSSVEEIKEALMLSLFVMENKMGETVEECGAVRTSLIGNHSNTAGVALSGNSIRNTLSAMSSDIAAIKSKLANSRGDFSSTTADPTTTPGSRYSTTPFSRITTTPQPGTAQYVSLTNFDELVRRKQIPLTGQTFNGSTVSDIISSVSRVGYGGNGVVVVFINHLDRTINNFKMDDPKNSSLHAAPSSIAPHTKEVFTFAEPPVGGVKTAFSYEILGNTASISSLIDFYYPGWCGLAFVPNGKSMEQYLITRTGFPGSSREESLQTQQLAIRYQNLYAKMSVNAIGIRKATFVIEIVEESNPRNYWNEFSSTTETTTTSERYETTERHTTGGSRYSTTSYPYWGATNVPGRPDIAPLATLRYFDGLVRGKSTPLTGKTFNGSTVNDIMSRVSRVGNGGRGVVVVLINHLDRTVYDFKMYDQQNSALHPAPSSIAPHTKEVFTFAEPSCCYVTTAFSYIIDGINARIASFMDFSGSDLLGVAFVPKSQSMENYFNTHTGYPGFSRRNVLQTQQLDVGYQNVYAKMSVNVISNRKATVVIEIVEILDGTTSGPPHYATSDEYFPTESYYQGETESTD